MHILTHIVADDTYDSEALNGDQDELDVFNNMQRHVANVYKRLHFSNFAILSFLSFLIPILVLVITLDRSTSPPLILLIEVQNRASTH